MSFKRIITQELVKPMTAEELFQFLGNLTEPPTSPLFIEVQKEWFNEGDFSIPFRLEEWCLKHLRGRVTLVSSWTSAETTRDVLNDGFNEFVETPRNGFLYNSHTVTINYDPSHARPLAASQASVLALLLTLDKVKTTRIDSNMISRVDENGERSFTYQKRYDPSIKDRVWVMTYKKPPFSAGVLSASDKGAFVPLRFNYYMLRAIWKGVNLIDKKFDSPHPEINRNFYPDHAQEDQLLQVDEYVKRYSERVEKLIDHAALCMKSKEGGISNEAADILAKLIQLETTFKEITILRNEHSVWMDQFVTILTELDEQLSQDTAATATD